MNVCVDCRILMLDEARTYMELIKADFLITGEVLGQRPFSQLRDKMFLVEREAKVRGKLLRPLSAKLLRPTEPELSGLVDREQLEGISGRGRKRQLQLAEEFGLSDYPSPASGCLLTDAGYSRRLRDLMEHSEGLTFEDLNLLRVGRHFRLDAETKLVVGRDEEDNEQILACRQDYHYLLEVSDAGSPIALLIGNASQVNLTFAAGITARYSSARRQPKVRVVAEVGGEEIDLVVKPTSDEEIKPIALR